MGNSIAKRGLNIVFFGSTLLSTYGNSVATYYRGIIRQLHQYGHRVTFYEPDISSRRQHCDLPEQEWASVVVYPANEDGVYQALAEVDAAHLIIKVSNVGICDELLEAAVLELQDEHTQVLFWDVNAPVTLERLASDPADPFYDHIARYDLILTSAGGSIVERYKALGARDCVPIFSAFDPQSFYPVAPDPRFQGALGFLEDYRPGYEAQVEEFFLKPAATLLSQRFLLGGTGWNEMSLPANVRYVGHVQTEDLNAFNGSPLAILSVSPIGSERYGFSPPARFFEAGGAGVCMISDAWEGIARFLEPGHEILVAKDGDDVVEYLNNLTVVRAHEIGQAARARILAEHTYAHRAEGLEAVLTGVCLDHMALPSINGVHGQWIEVVEM